LNVLVTGATGFLGGWVTRALLSAGHSVRALVRDPRRSAPVGEAGAKLVTGDILSCASLDAAMADMDAVVHCAGSVSMSPRDRREVTRVNVEGTRNVLEVALRRGARVLHTSSTACVGPALTPLVLDETASAAPLPFACPYVDSKRTSEQLALSYPAKGLHVVVLNPGVILGPADPKYSSTTLVLHYLRGELRMYPRGGGSISDVRDVAEAFVAALEHGTSGERYILGGVNVGYREVMKELQRLTGLHACAPLPPGLAEIGAFWSEVASVFWRHPYEPLNQAVVRWGSLFNYCESGRARRELGYCPRPLTETLGDTIADHLRRGAAKATTTHLMSMMEGPQPKREPAPGPAAPIR
jgi:dihydroflavonol-4-reductase